MKKSKMLPLLAAGVVAFASCDSPKGEASVVKAIDTANLDTTVAPSADFYEYACGGWKKNNPIKPEYARYGVMDMLLENNQEIGRAHV